MSTQKITLEHLDAKIGLIAASVTALEVTTGRELKAVHGRIGDVNRTIETLTRRVEAQNGRVDWAHEHIGELRQAVGELQGLQGLAERAASPAPPQPADDPPYITRRELVAAAKALGWVLGGIIALVELAVRVGPYIVKAVQ